MNQNGKTSFSPVGDHPALQFVNTRPMGPDGLVERLTDFRQATFWAINAGVLPKSTAQRISRAEGDDELVRIRRLREELRKGLELFRQGEADWCKLRRMVNSILKDQSTAQKLIMRDDGFELETLRTIHAPADVTGVIAETVADFLVSGDWRKARSCNGSGCVLWFVDRTRNGSRHWCRMETCGARAKAKAYYHRKKNA